MTTTAERTALDYPCPLCHAQAHFRCLRANRSVPHRLRERPHLQRIALAEEARKALSAEKNNGEQL